MARQPPGHDVCSGEKWKQKTRNQERERNPVEPVAPAGCDACCIGAGRMNGLHCDIKAMAAADRGEGSWQNFSGWVRREEPDDGIHRTSMHTACAQLGPRPGCGQDEHPVGEAVIHHTDDLEPRTSDHVQAVGRRHIRQGRLRHHHFVRASG